MKKQWPEQNETYRLPWQDILPNYLDVAIPDLSGSEHVSSEVIDALKKAESTIIASGITCHSVDSPDMSDLNTLANVVLSSECSSLFERNILSHPELVGRQVRRRLIKGFYLGPTDYFDAIKVRALFLRNFLEIYLKSARFLILPTTPEGAPNIKYANSGTPTEIEEKFGYLSYWTRGINYLGLPAISFPVHKTIKGLPLALQIVGRPYDEYGILALAKIMESKIKRGDI